MAKHGTLPEFIYQGQCVASDELVTLTTFVAEQTGAGSCRKQRAPLERKRVTTKSPMSSNPAATKRFKQNLDAEGRNSLIQGEIGSSATFFLGARPRFGRVVRFNNRFLS